MKISENTLSTFNKNFATECYGNEIIPLIKPYNPLGVIGSSIKDVDKKIVIKSGIKFNKILKGNTTDLVSSIAVGDGIVALISSDMKSGVYYEFGNHSIKAIEDVIQPPEPAKKSEYKVGEYCILDPLMDMDSIKRIMDKDGYGGFVDYDMPSYGFSIGKVVEVRGLLYGVLFDTDHSIWIYPKEVLVGLDTEKVEELISSYASKI